MDWIEQAKRRRKPIRHAPLPPRVTAQERAQAKIDQVAQDQAEKRAMLEQINQQHLAGVRQRNAMREYAAAKLGETAKLEPEDVPFPSVRA